MEGFTKALARTKKRKALAGGKVRLWNISRGWAHQGFFYLDRTQRAGRVILEIVPTAIIVWLVSTISGLALSNVWLWCAGLFTSHTLNWVFNCNWWAGMLFTFPGLRNPGERATCDYLNGMGERLRNDRAISGVMIFGSVSRGRWHDRSDLDVRLLRREGVRNGIAGVLVLLRERVIALWARQPLDVYLADGIPYLKRMREDEPPVFLKKDDPRLDQAYPGEQEARIETLTTSRDNKTAAGVAAEGAS